MKCPSCGTESRGNFCSGCGSSLRDTSCAECGTKLLPGARFCNSCGTPVAAATSRASGRTVGGRADRSNLPWYIAGGVLLVIIVVLVGSMWSRDEIPAPGTAPFMGSPAAPGTPPALNGTPRELADRLFNRIMGAREQGDMATAQQFAPMGIQAYEGAEPLDDDGLYHLAIIHNVAGNYEEGRTTAERILAGNPNHLLALAAAAEAMEGAGDQTAALQYHQRFLDSYNAEIGRALPEYLDHARIMPEYREAALRATRR
jgi:hypothetical protein